MTVQTCLDNAVTGGEITVDERAALRTLHQGLLDHYGNADQARAEMVTRLMRQAEHARRQALITEDVRQRVETYMLSYRNARGEPDPAQALIHLIEHNGQVRMPTGMSSVVGRYQSLAGLAQARMEGAIHEFKRTWITGATRSTARLENVVREAFGEATGDAAAVVLARAWGDTSEWLRMRFNEAGGAIGQLQDWGMPQVHDRRALLRAGFDTWRDYIAPRLDLARMRHPLTGNAMTAADLDGSLRYIWRNITTDGWFEREASAQRRGLGAVSNQRADARFLHFRDAGAWLEYQAEFGGGADPFAAMMSHLKGMSEDVAAMEVLGPNPAATLTYLQNFVTRQAALRVAGEQSVFPSRTALLGKRLQNDGWLSTNPEDYARKAVKKSTDMWDIYRGAAGAAVSQTVADVGGALRNWNVATKLGGATVSAITDSAFQLMARHYAGIGKAWQIPEMVAAFRSGSQREAVAAGLILDTALNVMNTEARWVGGLDGRGMSAILSDRVIAYSGLQAWTQAGRHAFGLAIMGELGLRAADRFDQLHPNLQRTLSRYGLDAADWDTLRAVPLHAGSFLRPMDVLRAHEGDANLAPRRLGERYLEMILQETEYSTPQGTLQAKAIAYGGLKKGTLRDEAFRSMGQFKMFGLSVLLSQTQRVMTTSIEDGGWRGAGYAASLLISTTLLGALVIQLQQVAWGKDPRPMDGKHAVKFWGAAMMQGGGLGIFGDFLSAETARTGGGLARTIMGPTGDVIASGLALTSGNAAEFLRGEKTNFGRELTRFAGANTPGGTLWYARAAYEHVVLDRLQKTLDPEAHTAFRRKIDKQRRDQGNDFWWRPGEAGPDRGPRLTR